MRGSATFGSFGLHAVHPVLLRSPTHHDQIAGAGLENHRAPAAARPDEKAPRRAQCENRNDRLRLSARESVAMPGRAVLSITVQVQPQIVVIPHAVVPGQRQRSLHKHLVRHVLQLLVLRCQPGFDERLIEQLSVMLSPGYGSGRGARRERGNLTSSRGSPRPTNERRGLRAAPK